MEENKTTLRSIANTLNDQDSGSTSTSEEECKRLTNGDSQISLSMMQFFKHNAVGVPIGFAERFVNNYMHRDVWLSSDKLFEWFVLIRPKYSYNDFLKKLRHIVKESERKETWEKSSQQQDELKSKRKIYLIS